MEKLRRFSKIIFSFLIFSFLIVAAFSEEKKSTITIEKAQKTEYKKGDGKTGDSIVLTGGVVISVENGTDKNTINADKVTYIRENDMIYAEGNVSLQSSGSSSGGEDMTADSLIFNTMTMEGVFDNGRIVQSQSDAMNLPSGSKLVVFSDNFGRDSSGTIAFKSGELTFCDDPNPHWKIRASRIWLLPGGEFAFLNALVFVGRFPIMYLPAFYYPKDELIFNPAFGYDNRRGYFLNTTTYLAGRKPIDAKTPQNMRSSSSNDTDIDLYSFMKPSKLKEQVREGLILHNTDKDFSESTSNYLKFMADYYTKLGGMAGVDAVYNSGKFFSTLEASLKLGFSNTLFQADDPNTYTPFALSGDKYYDQSEFLTMKLPFRYSGKVKMAFSKPFNFSLSLPIYSDPYFYDDFDIRAESMDWISYLMNGGMDKSDNITVSEVSSFTWEMNGSYSPSIPNVLKPYISSASVSSVSSSMLFSSISRATGEAGGWTAEETADKVPVHNSDGTGSPMSRFYYPSQVTPFKISTRISGTIFQYPPASKTTTSKKVLNAGLNVPDEFLTEEEVKKREEEKEKAELAKKAAEAKEKNGDDAETEPVEVAENTEEPEEETEDLIFDESVLPDISASSVPITAINGIKYNLNYSISPEYITQISYASTNPNNSQKRLDKPSDFSWEEIQSTYQQFKAPTTLTSTLNYRDSFLSLTDTYNFNPIYQDHPYLDKDYYTESSKKSVLKTDYSARKLDLTNTNTLSFKPFAYTAHFAETGVTYNTTMKMIRTKYISEDENEPEWEYLTTDLTDEECFTTHNLNFIFAAKEGNFTQNLTLTTTLPPQVDNYHGVFTFGSKHTSFSISSGFKQKSKDDDTWVKENLSQSFSLKLFNSKINLTESYVYNLEDENHDSLRFSLSGYGLQLAYTSSYVQGYDFDEKSGYKLKQDKEFQPYSLSLAYTMPSKTFKYLSDKVSFAPTLSTSIVYDFLRPTNSYFTFRPTFSFKIDNALDISFSLESRNSVIYRYIKDLTGTDIDIGGETNIFKDLVDSFRFDDENLRKASGFKMKSFNMKISHDLHDWTLSAEFSVKPRLLNDSETNKSYYDFSPYMSFSVLWKPLEGIKTSIVDDYGEWKLNPSKTSD